MERFKIEKKGKDPKATFIGGLVVGGCLGILINMAIRQINTFLS